MPTFPVLSPDVYRTRLASRTANDPPVRMVLDTDTFTEIDDQFALVYAMLSPERVSVEAIYAAPFVNERADTPAEGMEKSFEEILRLLDLLGHSPENFAFRGSTEFLVNVDDLENPPRSAAVDDLISRAMATPDGEVLYVVGIGAITNVATALILEPQIIEKIVVVWLGGQPPHFPFTTEYNFSQDIPASRLLFDCGVPLVHVPCETVAGSVITTITELETYLEGHGPVAEYLLQTYRDYIGNRFAFGKQIWDLAAVAWLIQPQSVPTDVRPSPVLTIDNKWAFSLDRHPVAVVRSAARNDIFRDLFRKLP